MFFGRNLNESNDRMSIKPDIEALRTEQFPPQNFGFLVNQRMDRAMEKPPKKQRLASSFTNEAGCTRESLLFWWASPWLDPFAD